MNVSGDQICRKDTWKRLQILRKVTESLQTLRRIVTLNTFNMAISK